MRWANEVSSRRVEVSSPVVRFGPLKAESRPPRDVPRLPHDRSHLLWEVGESAGGGGHSAAGEGGVTVGGGGPSALFLDSIDRWVDAMVADEQGGGVAIAAGEAEFVRGHVRAKAAGLIAGCAVADRLVERHFAACQISWNVFEGDTVARGDAILSLSGPAGRVLRCERILLNLLGRMSGIATWTADWVGAAGPMGVACTRKTEWGFLDKWAVHVGGGLTHRLSRADALMIKENDLAALAPDIADEASAVAAAVSGIDMDAHAAFTVVEVGDTDQAVAAAQAWVENQVERSGTERVVLLLDNMGSRACAAAHERLATEGLRAWCILEGSGGVSRAELSDWVASGVDLISTSALNRGVSPLDLSMKIDGGE